MSRADFYAHLRKRNVPVFGTRLSQNQVKGIEGIIDAFETHGDGKADTLAYALATARHEVGARMLPVREGFKTSDAAARRYVQRNYGHKGKNWYCWPAGPYGHVYYGRGLPQLTWHDNYVSSSKEAGVDLARDPDQMLDPVISARVLFRGLLDGRWNGRGKGLRFYLDKNPPDLKNARRTVNITDKWKTIAGYHRHFLAAIEAAGGVSAMAAPHTPEIAPAPPTKPPRRGNWLKQVISGILAVFGRKD